MVQSHGMQIQCTSGNILDIYTLKVSHKISELHSDTVYYDVNDLERGWQILDHQPLNLPNDTPHSHYDLESYIRTYPEYIPQFYHNI